MIPLCSYHVSFAYRISHVSNGEDRRSLVRQPSPSDLSPAEVVEGIVKRALIQQLEVFRVLAGKD